MRRSVIETIMGAVVLVVAGLFLFFAYSSSNVRATDGYELIASIRRRGVATPAVALTAFAHADDRARALAEGYQAHVAKPIDLAELLGVVVRLADSAGRSR